MNYDSNLDESKLKQFRIHELRDLAGKIGVQSPTSQNKDELIEKILKIISGEVAPYVKTSGKGRPSRRSNNVASYFIPENVNSDVNEFSELNNNKFDFYAAMPAFEFNANEEAKCEVKGYLDVTTSGYGIIRVNGFGVSDEDVYVHKMFVTKHNLSSGDYVKALAKSVYDNRPKAVTEILEVNQGNLKSEIKFDNLKKCETAKSFKLLNESIVNGTTSVILSDNKVMFAEATELIKNIPSNYKVIVVAPSKFEEEFVENNNVIFAPFNVTKNYLNVYSNLKLALLKAKNLAEQNNVVLVVSGINYFYRALMALISDSEQNSFKLEEMVKQELTKIMLSAKAMVESSLSIILYDTNKLEQKLLDFVKFDIGTLLDNNFKLGNNKLIKNV